MDEPIQLGCREDKADRLVSELAITVARKIKHPAVVTLCDRAREMLSAIE